MDLTPELQLALDRAAIRNVIERYMAAVDQGDHAAVAACFTDDARIEMDVRPLRFTGGAELVEWFRGFGGLASHTHVVSSCVIDVRGDVAHVDTFGIAIHVAAVGPDDVRVRGLRYVDTVMRAPGGWRISARKHTPTWQFVATSVPPALPVDRHAVYRVANTAQS